MSWLYYSRSSFGPTLETERLPVVGDVRRTVPTAWHVFWRNLALVLLVATIVRLIVDVARL